MEERHTINLDNGKYIIEYDKTNSFPETVYRYGEYWNNIVGDNLIYFLCAEIDKLKEQLKERV